MLALARQLLGRLADWIAEHVVPDDLLVHFEDAEDRHHVVEVDIWDTWLRSLTRSEP